MSITYTWTIPTCEHDIASGGRFASIEARLTALEGV